MALLYNLKMKVVKVRPPQPQLIEQGIAGRFLNRVRGLITGIKKNE